MYFFHIMSHRLLADSWASRKSTIMPFSYLMSTDFTVSEHWWLSDLRTHTANQMCKVFARKYSKILHLNKTKAGWINWYDCDFTLFSRHYLERPPFNAINLPLLITGMSASSAVSLHDFSRCNQILQNLKILQVLLPNRPGSDPSSRFSFLPFHHSGSPPHGLQKLLTEPH